MTLSADSIMLNFIHLLIHTSYNSSGYVTEHCEKRLSHGNAKHVPDAGSTLYMKSHVNGDSSYRLAFPAEHVATKSSGRAYRSTPKATQEYTFNVQCYYPFPEQLYFCSQNCHCRFQQKWRKHTHICQALTTHQALTRNSH